VVVGGAERHPVALAFFLMVAFHVTYLRTRRRRHAVRVIGACLLALAADPRGLLFLGVLPFLSLAYFTEGPSMPGCGWPSGGGGSCG
jgi:hypothetical protein